jgi:hypothetical protein
MDMSIALILGQDGITNGAIYALWRWRWCWCSRSRG